MVTYISVVRWRVNAEMTEKKPVAQEWHRPTVAFWQPGAHSFTLEATTWSSVSHSRGSKISGVCVPQQVQEWSLSGKAVSTLLNGVASASK